ncbi:MAG: DNA-binding response regulator [Cytophagales bacterium]|nr:MAG: DNA-binding response regulator [Cytophagales bacterium]
MKIIIIEDEAKARKRLIRMIKEINHDSEVIAELESIEMVVNFWKNNLIQPELIFLDIHLADGNSFEIFKHCTIKCPIIFTTAYDEYALEAFKVNSIDYLLKPITEETLQKALQKYQTIKNSFLHTAIMPNYQNLLEWQDDKKYKNRFMVKSGQKIKTITTEKIAYFYTEDQAVMLCTHAGELFVIDYTLEDLEKKLPPDIFFRLNRQYIAHINALVEIHPYFKGKMKVTLQPTPKNTESIIISHLRAPDFKNWLGK